MVLQTSQANNTEEPCCCFHGGQDVPTAAELQNVSGVVQEMGLMQEIRGGLSQKMGLAQENGSGLSQKMGLVQENGDGLSHKMGLVQENGDGLSPKMGLAQENGGGLSQKLGLVQENGGGLSQKMQENGGGLIKRKYGISDRRRLKKRRVHVCAKTRWSTEETEALLKAIESCNLSDSSWSFQPDKWERVLQHMQEHGFSEKNTSTVQKKYQNIHWAFRNLKAWRVRNKRPLFESLSSSERIARLLPCSFCPTLYTRMEAFFASTGLNDGVNTVKDQDHDSIRRIGKPQRRFYGANDDDDDDEDDDDDDDYNPSYYISRGRSLPVNSLALSLPDEKLKKGKAFNCRHVNVQQREKPHIRHGAMRGCLLTEGMDLAEAFNERNLRDINDVGDRRSRLKEENVIEENPNEVKVAEQRVKYLVGMKASTEASIEGDDNNSANDDDDDDDDADDYGPCGDEVEGQFSIMDEKTLVILRHIESTDKQLSDYIQAVKMSIQTVNLLLDSF